MKFSAKENDVIVDSFIPILGPRQLVGKWVVIFIPGGYVTSYPCSQQVHLDDA